LSAPFGGGVYVVDTSAWLRGHEVGEEWSAAVQDGQIITTPILAFELLRTARDRQTFDDLEEELSALKEVRLDRGVVDAARSALREMARTGQHRLPFQDLLVAAAAQAHGVGVLHYDGHFDRLAQFLSFESRWITTAASAREPKT
jgi:predicted nucleic acid-binding protein